MAEVASAAQVKMTGSEEANAAKATLRAYLGKTLRITASDGRVFVGQMKCTDRVSRSYLDAPGMLHPF